ncbi:hypothetical protein F4V91_30520 [Neorhizobium galegae]|uniref:Uncharacterized protein n=1 Tax=Neorhizobium galegae TaxID=399 RepID=A0A6A1TLM9_NEOGA|nr:hypothetical protein F4V91_30520 [Neorhizobium galegae]
MAAVTYSLCSMDPVTFEGGSGTYDHHDAEGFMMLNGVRLKNWAARIAKAGCVRMGDTRRDRRIVCFRLSLIHLGRQLPSGWAMIEAV